MNGFFADLRSGLAELHVERFDYPRFALALALGLAGGFLFFRLMKPAARTKSPRKGSKS